MDTKRIYKFLMITSAALLIGGCSLPPALVHRSEIKTVPASFNGSTDTTNTASVRWREYFKDNYLIALIDTALKNNQELNITLQEINIARNEVRARKGEYLPFVGAGASAGAEKAGRYTRAGVVEANHEIKEGKEFPEPLSDFAAGINASWELDIWKKLRNAKKSAVLRYLSSVEGKNFMVTNLIAEVANSYYELMALDNQLDILRQNVEIQQNALRIVRLQKEAAKVTELAVRKFEAEVLKNRSRQYEIMQLITETQNRINFLVGRFPQPVQRNSQSFTDFVADSIHAGIPSQLLLNRPDIRQSERELSASKVDVKVARANFYPSMRITAGLGYQAFNPRFLMSMPESLIYSIGADLAAPLINRNAIRAFYYSATSKQIQNVYNYERTVLNAYIEVANQLSNINNLRESYALKTQQVAALTQSIEISNTLFMSARADYMEVLLTQRDALDSRFELIETKMQQMHAMVNIYQALGGGWN